MFRILSALVVVLMSASAIAETPSQMAPGNTPKQMPQFLQLPEAIPTLPVPTTPPQMPQHLYPNARPPMPRAMLSGPGRFLLQCRTNRTTLLFLMDLERGLVGNLTTLPRTVGRVFASESEYYLIFNSRNYSVPVEMVVSRYTGRLTAVADGRRVMFSGICRRGQARTLF